MIIKKFTFTFRPGVTNCVTPLQDALMDGVPLVVFSGQVSSHLLGTDAFQVRIIFPLIKCLINLFRKRMLSELLDLVPNGMF